MFSPSSRPALRPVESIVVPDARHGRVLVLRDTQGITDAQAVLPPALVPVVARFVGQETCAEIARALTAEGDEDLPVEVVVALANKLDEGLFLDSPRFRRARAEVHAAFRAAPVREASHAGGAYPGEPQALRRYLNDRCLGAVGKSTIGSPAPTAALARRAVALVAPHIDPWRGALGYGHAYGALRATLPAEADTFVLLGTSHAPMNEPFALCRKAFATPFGDLPADMEAIDALAKTCPFDAFADDFNHKREHSLEFQAVFLKHLLEGDGRPAHVVPILAGLGRHQADGSDPETDPASMAFIDGLRDLVARRGHRVVLIAGADLAHVGPRFGDPKALSARQRKALEATDRQSLALAVNEEPRAFWEHVAGDLDTRRVCGLGPIYTLLQVLAAAMPRAGSGTLEGEILHYEQTVDPEEGSVVSHSAVGFFAR